MEPIHNKSDFIHQGKLEFIDCSGYEKLKCGEIYLNPEGNYELQCIFCLVDLNNLEIFIQHVRLHCVDRSNEIAKLPNLKVEETIEVEALLSPTKLTSPHLDEPDAHDKEEIFVSTDQNNEEQQISSNDKIEDGNFDQNVIKDKSIKCKFCDEMFYCRVEKCVHEVVHDVEIFYCDLCMFASSSNNEIIIHKRKIHNKRNSRTTVTCDHCQSCFLTESDLQLHKTSESSLKAKSNQSRGKKALQVELLSEPNETPSNSDKKCDHCSEVFRTKRDRLIHYQKYNIRPLKCPQCPKTFRLEIRMKEHIRQHTGEKPFKCPICDKGFPIESYVSVHTRLVHEREKPYQCEMCGEKFSISWQLARHKRHHAGVERNKICDICGKGFEWPQQLAEHKSSHTGERPHSCHLCERTFTSKKKLRVHIRIHAGINPFKCRHCEMTFIHSGTRNLHEQKNHIPKVEEENLFETEKKKQKKINQHTSH